MLGLIHVDKKEPIAIARLINIGNILHVLTKGQHNSSEINLDYASYLAGFMVISPGSRLNIW